MKLFLRASLPAATAGITLSRQHAAAAVDVLSPAVTPHHGHAQFHRQGIVESVSLRIRRWDKSARGIVHINQVNQDRQPGR